ncbi:MAG: helix-turn-helix transcriptional regulator [Microscillaceae bacterium]|nr:helix-turn-helix transcriptional regulator [Microscillaceae bacterium]
MFFNKNLRYLRRHQKNGLSQAQMAQQLRISRAALVSYENGHAEPNLALLNGMARFFAVSLEELVNEDLSGQPVLRMPEACTGRQEEI